MFFTPYDSRMRVKTAMFPHSSYYIYVKGMNINPTSPGADLSSSDRMFISCAAGDDGICYPAVGGVGMQQLRDISELINGFIPYIYSHRRGCFYS